MKTLIARTRVLPGGMVQILSPDLPPGADAIVTIELQNSAGMQEGPKTLTGFRGACRGVYGPAADVDEYIRGLRDEWNP